ncbi:MAG TPA: sugar transferase [Candidatus Eisenbacteria bacterium]|nr:sugar transferase [Candidatus Eisenbacteria bacterium]
MRILFLTQYWPPETGAAPARAAHFVRALIRTGHEVRVVTGLPNHPAGVIPVEWRGAAGRSETWEGASVERVWLWTTPRKTTVTRLWNHLTYAWSALGPALRGPKPDLVLASVPPLFLGVTAWVAARRHHAPLVLDLRDDWPHAALALGEMRPGPAAAALAALSGFLIHRAARIIAVTPGMQRQLESRGVDAGRLELVTNGADTDLFRPAPAAVDARDGARPLRVLYAGTHGLVHGMEALLDAAEDVRDQPICFELVGDGVAKPALEARARAAGLRNVTFAPCVSPAELVARIIAADVCVATTRDHPFCGETIPVKLFDYLACGRPVVAAVRGDAAEVVEASGGGVVVAPGDGHALARALSALATDSARRAALAAAGPKFVEANYSRRALGQHLCAIVDEVLAKARGRAVTPRPGGLYRAARRVVDVVVSAALLIVLSPVLAAIAIAVRRESPGPALFRQRRVGRGSAEFIILKFRTMRAGTPDLASHLVGPGSSQVTQLGRFLRRSSLDELPQLFNVLAGDMTLVGPRPALFNQDDLIALRQREGVDALKPGVTGWAQIHGRDDLPVPVKVEYDRQYLARLSPWLDLAIALRTPFALLSSRGVF